MSTPSKVLKPIKLKNYGECAICLEDIEGHACMYKTPCGHMFHKSCIQDWKQKDITCPTCRSVMSTAKKVILPAIANRAQFNVTRTTQLMNNLCPLPSTGKH